MSERRCILSGERADPAHLVRLAISPDGDKLAYVNYDKDGFSLYLLRGLKAAVPVATPSLNRRQVPVGSEVCTLVRRSFTRESSST